MSARLRLVLAVPAVMSSLWGLLACGGGETSGGAPSTNVAGNVSGAQAGATTQAGSGGTAGSTGGAPAAGAGGASDTAGAGGSGAQATAGSGGAIGAYRACEMWVQANCEKNAECAVSEPERLPDCVSQNKLYCPDILFLEGSTRTPQGMVDCAASLATFPCSDWQRGVLPSCASAGTLQGGGSCRYSSQCASRDCLPLSGDYKGCRYCTHLAQPGGPCTYGVSCPDGQTCSADVCVDIVIDPNAPPPPEQMDPIPPGTEGQPCAGAELCTEGLYCQGYPTQQGPVDTSCEPVLASGADCSTVSDAISNPCTDGTYCDGVSCVPLPITGLCAAVAPFCAAGYYCDISPDAIEVGDSMCRPYGQANSPCDPFARSLAPCAPDLVCGCADESCMTRACGVAAIEGEPCGNGVVCEGVLRCSAGVCITSDETIDYPVCEQ